MCFLNEGDWTASLVEKQDTIAQKETSCDECCTKICVGDPLHTVYMQEHEECGRCDNGECECDKCCQCPEPDIGETFSYECCDQCHKFLQAVENAELEAGCDRSDSRPSYGAMHEEIRDGGAHEAKKYYTHAARDFPELVQSGYLKELWQEMFAQ
jgi:hypothetical protein